MIGKTIAHYQAEEKFGEGGMEVVYRALDPVQGTAAREPQKITHDEMGKTQPAISRDGSKK